ncbi:hypothetical protein MFORT_29379, partial [Mycolicibacterium fortuitum subsp. fortuitum DSM 46621 = ATCC 6841 = JCM 6387]
NFADAAARLNGAESCSARVNLELVRETLGDRAAATSDNRAALSHYLAARDVVDRAPDGCFAGDDAPARLNRKIGAAGAVVAPNPPPPPPAAQAPPPGPAGAAPTRSPNRLDPTAGDPLDRLQQILRDAASG